MPYRGRRRFGGRIKRVRYKHIKVSGALAINALTQGSKEVLLPIPETMTGIGTATAPVVDYTNMPLVNVAPPALNGGIHWKLLYIAPEPERIVGLTIWCDFHPDGVAEGITGTGAMTTQAPTAPPSLVHSTVGYLVVRVPAGEPIGNTINPETVGQMMFSQLYVNAKNTMLYGTGIVSGNQMNFTHVVLANKMHTKRKLFDDDRVYVGIFSSQLDKAVVCAINVVAFVES